MTSQQPIKLGANASKANALNDEILEIINFFLDSYINM